MAELLSETSEAILDRIGGMLLECAPPGWTRIEVDVWANIQAYQFSMLVYLADGTTPPIESPRGFTDPITQLRAEMYRSNPSRGAWLSARLNQTPDERLTATFNHDADPCWWPSLPPDAFAHDLEAFPRPVANIPSWLRDKLQSAN